MTQLKKIMLLGMFLLSLEPFADRNHSHLFSRDGHVANL
jgi:hypothetical protein